MQIDDVGRLHVEPACLETRYILLVGATAPPPASYDIAIRDSRVLDGAGTQEIDARGRYVSPGFIWPVTDCGPLTTRRRERTFEGCPERSLSSGSDYYQRRLDFRTLRQRQRVLHVNAELPHRIFDLCVIQ